VDPPVLCRRAAAARRIGQALLDRGLSAERPLVILSGNDLEHFQLALGAMYAGIPYAPLSPAYSLVATDPAKLRDLIEQLTPGAVFACDGTAFARALEAVLPPDAELILARGEVPGRGGHQLRLAARHRADHDRRAQRGSRPGTIAKFLFTSGSTKKPKAVITTHQMLCAVTSRCCCRPSPSSVKEPPVLLDWLPWNHTFGGSHNVGIVLYNGGTLYLDDGRPTPKDFAGTLRNLREIAPTVYFNIPVGWEMLAEALETDDGLAQTFFSRVKLFFCAGAGCRRRPGSTSTRWRSRAAANRSAS
jgi:feruloyl-CoA synthase